jgi:membrane protease subunit HflK
VYKAYSENKAVVKARNYMDTMERVLKASPKIIMDPKMGKDLVPYLPVNDLKRPRPGSDMNNNNATDVKVETK